MAFSFWSSGEKAGNLLACFATVYTPAWPQIYLWKRFQTPADHSSISAPLPCPNVFQQIRACKFGLWHLDKLSPVSWAQYLKRLDQTPQLIFLGVVNRPSMWTALQMGLGAYPWQPLWQRTLSTSIAQSGVLSNKRQNKTTSALWKLIISGIFYSVRGDEVLISPCWDRWALLYTGKCLSFHWL